MDEPEWTFQLENGEQVYLTEENASLIDYSNFDGCETAEECAWAAGVDDEVYVVDFNAEEFEKLVEF